MTVSTPLSPPITSPRLTSLAHGGGCGCKIAPDVLEAILADMPAAGGHANLLVDASTRDDAAVYRLDDQTALVATTDFFMPIVDDPFDFGRIAATNALSDVFAMGARPIFALALTAMPVGVLAPEVIRAILEGGRAAAEAVGAPIAGGHSIDSVEPIYGLAALGLVHPDRILTNAGARPGDAVILTKPLGVGVLSAALKRDRLDPEDYAAMLASMTMANTPGPRLAAIEGVHAATDVTGFGLLGHGLEMARGAGLTLTLEAHAPRIFPAARRFAGEGVVTGASARTWAAVASHVTAPDDWPEPERAVFCDPQTSGGLLIACAPDAVGAVLSICHEEGHRQACVIGRFTPGPAGVVVA